MFLHKCILRLSHIPHITVIILQIIIQIAPTQQRTPTQHAILTIIIKLLIIIPLGVIPTTITLTPELLLSQVTVVRIRTLTYTLPLQVIHITHHRITPTGILTAHGLLYTITMGILILGMGTLTTPTIRTITVITTEIMIMETITDSHTLQGTLATIWQVDTTPANKEQIAGISLYI